MNSFFKFLLSGLLFIGISCTLPAQTLTVKAPAEVAVGQRFQVSFEVNSKADKFQGPTFKGLSVLSGPNSSFSSSMSFVNGKRTSQQTQSYNYIVTADEVGTVNIGIASCHVDGKKITSTPFRINVVKGQNNPGQQSTQGAQSQNRNNAATGINDQTLFARVQVSKSNPYQGEQIIVSYKIYTQVSLQNFQLNKLPGNKGFWSEDLSEGRQIEVRDEVIDGKKYSVAEIRRGAMFAQESGKLTIEPLSLEVLALVPRQRQRTGTIWDLFDDPFFNSAQAVQKELKTNSLSVNVKPLPSAPEGFSGGVGNFTVKAESDLTQIRANEALTYRVTVQGNGNLMLLETPKINFPPVFDVYEPRVIDNIKRGDSGISGSRTFEWVLIPQSKGNYEIPELEYIYFNPAQKQYVTRRCPAIAVTVEAGNPATKVVTTAQSDVKMLNNDIHHIKGNSRFADRNSNLQPRMAQWIIALFVLFATVAAIVTGRKQQALQADEKGMRLRRATKLAKKRLRTAEKYLSEGNDNKFYEEIYKALWGCISDKYGIELRQLSRETVEAILKEKQVAAEQQERIMRTIADVDFARFASGDASSKKQEIYQEAIETIVAL